MKSRLVIAVVLCVGFAVASARYWTTEDWRNPFAEAPASHYLPLRIEPPSRGVSGTSTDSDASTSALPIISTGGYGTVSPDGACLPSGAVCECPSDVHITGVCEGSTQAELQRDADRHVGIDPSKNDYRWPPVPWAEMELTSGPNKDQCYIIRKGEEIDAPALWCDEAGLR